MRRPINPVATPYAEFRILLWTIMAALIMATFGMVIFLVAHDNQTASSQSSSANCSGVVQGTCSCVSASTNATCACTQNAANDVKTFVTNTSSVTDTLIITSTSNSTNLLINAIESLSVFISNLFVQYFGVGCFTITSVPFELPDDNTCYRLGGNFVLDSANIVAITVPGRFGVVIDFAGYAIIVDAVGALPVGIYNSSSVQIINAKLTAPEQQSSWPSNAIIVTYSSRSVTITDMFCENMNVCVLTLDDSDVAIINPYVLQRYPGGGQSVYAVAGVAAENSAMYVQGGYFECDVLEQTQITDNLCIGILTTRSRPSVGTNNIRIQGPTRIVGYNYGMDIHRGSTGRIDGVAIEMGPHGFFASCAQFGSSGPFDALQVISGLSCDMNTSQAGSDGFLFLSFRSFIVTGVSARVVSLPPVPGLTKVLALRLALVGFRLRC